MASTPVNEDTNTTWHLKDNTNPVNGNTNSTWHAKTIQINDNNNTNTTWYQLISKLCNIIPSRQYENYNSRYQYNMASETSTHMSIRIPTPHGT
jgi:hypothetical protein